MKIFANLFPQGKKCALTMSYDDGSAADKRLVEIFNKYGIKGTFHLNGGRNASSGGVSPAEFKDVYAGHEVSCHMFSHPFINTCPDATLVNEIIEDRRVLEAACGYTVRGMSYPFGHFNEKAVEIFKACGMKYARTTLATNATHMPENFMRWHPTCHHKADLIKLFDNMVNSAARYVKHDVMYVWGHSYEFDNDNNWNVIEDFCKFASGNEDVWYATNIEIYDYVTASRNLEISVDGTSVYNPSNLSVWVTANGNPVEIKPGKNKLIMEKRNADSTNNIETD